MGFGAKPQARSQDASLSALRLIFKSSAFEPPDNKPSTDAGRVCQKALHDAEPTKHTQPFTEGKGFGVRDREIALLIKKIDLSHLAEVLIIRKSAVYCVLIKC